jgi:hypothetical protein
MCISSILSWLSVTANANLVISIASPIIAGCALVATIWNACAVRKHNKLSVMPYLAKEYLIEDGHFYFKLFNHGLGPAIIKSFDLLLDGKHYVNSNDIQEVLKLLFGEYKKFDYEGTIWGVDSVISANKSDVLLDVKFTGTEKPSEQAIYSRLKKASLVIKYESIYQEKDIINVF